MKGSSLGWVLAHAGPQERKPGTEKSTTRGRESLSQLPCLLGIRDLLTHLEPLVHPKYTPAKKVTIEGRAGSGSLPHLQTHWQGAALPSLFPKCVCEVTSSSLVSVKGREA